MNAQFEVWIDDAGIRSLHLRGRGGHEVTFIRFL